MRKDRTEKKEQTAGRVLARILLAQVIKFTIIHLLAKAALRSIERGQDIERRREALRSQDLVFSDDALHGLAEVGRQAKYFESIDPANRPAEFAPAFNDDAMATFDAFMHPKEA